MDRMKMETADMTAQNIERIAALFPSAVTEMRGADGTVKKGINFEVLKQLLSKDVVDGDECYEFTWVGKKAAIAEAARPTTKTLRPVVEDSRDWDTTENLYIEGDNLEVLKILQESYLGKVKMIYIDPPYNTGNDFIYRDDFATSADDFAEQSGEYDEETGERLFKNTESNGRFHSDWCSMLYSRLLLARNLLTNDGVIFISIDENEVSALKQICDETFGASNFVAELIWSAGRKNDSKHISVSHEYILCYFKNAEYIKEHKIIWRERKQGLDDIYSTYQSLKHKYGDDVAQIERQLRAWYKSLPDGHPAKDHAHYNRVDNNGIFFASDISWPGGGGPKYEILHPETHRPVKVPARGWITNKATMLEWISQGRVFFGENENAVPTIKSYLSEHEYGVPYSVFYKDGRAASKRLASLFGEKVFENPKDEEVLQRIIDFCGTGDNDIILDFFSGSGTTAHALFLANVEQIKRRKFILVQLPEEIDPHKATSEKSKKVAQNAIAFLDSIHKPHNLCEIGKERIRRAGDHIRASQEESRMTLVHEWDQTVYYEEHKEECDKLGCLPDEYLDKECFIPDLGFRVFRVDDSNMEDIYYHPEELDQQRLGEIVSNIKPDRSDLDLLYSCLLDWGVEINLPHTSEKVDGCTVHNVDDGALMACFDGKITNKVVAYIAERKPLRVVFRDDSFASDADRINIEEAFKNLSPDTQVKVI